MHHAAYASTSAAVVKAVHEAYPEAISKPHYSGCYALFVNVWCIVNLLFVYLIYVQFAVRLYCQNKFFFPFYALYICSVVRFRGGKLGNGTLIVE